MHNHNKILSSLSKRLSLVRPFPIKPHSNFIVNPNSNTLQKPLVLFPNTLESLETRFASIVQACTDTSKLQQGRQVHAQVIVKGLGKNVLGTKILGMYVLCGSIMDAINMFYKLELCYTLPWNWVIRGFTMMGWFNFALLFYFKMLGIKIYPDRYTFPYVIKACGGLNHVRLGKMVHKTIQFMGFEDDLFVGSSLIKLYADNGCVTDARQLFNKIPQRDCVLWNVMLNGYVKNGDWENAIGMYQEMRNCEVNPNSVTFACILSVCASKGMICLGSQLHGLVISSGFDMHSPVANTILAMYSKCGCPCDARKLFDTIPQTDSVTWNGIISGYVQNRLMDEASDLFAAMIAAGVKPDSVTFSSFLPSLIESGTLKQGKEIHCYIVRHGVVLDVFLKSALIDIYFKWRDIKSANNIFWQSTMVDVVVCTAMISGYSLNGMNIDALEIFRWLVQEKITPNSVTLASFLPACAALASGKLGRELHGYILKNGLNDKCYVGSAIIDMYAKCGRLDLACQFFRGMSDRDAVCWNSMITSCSQNGKPEMAIEIFCEMGISGAKYDSVSISAAISACANLSALYHGKEIHGFVVRRALNSDIFVDSAMIDMYSKCGNLELARCVFDTMHVKNEVSWNSIIAAYGNHGCFRECLDLFHEMLEAGLKPDHVTFLAIFSVCGHTGQVDEGIRYFRCMTEDYGISARIEHYACIVDLYGRAGLLNKAFETINIMPITPDAGVWGTLLGACRVHGNVELAEVASKHLFKLDPQNSGYYVLLSNIHADVGEWGGVLNTRSLMKTRGVQKVPGYSWIDVNTTTHMFVAADASHPQSSEIYFILNSLLLELRKEGYEPQLYLPMHPQTMGKKQQAENLSLLCSHQQLEQEKIIHM